MDSPTTMIPSCHAGMPWTRSTIRSPRARLSVSPPADRSAARPCPARSCERVRHRGVDVRVVRRPDEVVSVQVLDHLCDDRLVRIDGDQALAVEVSARLHADRLLVRHEDTVLVIEAIRAHAPNVQTRQATVVFEWRDSSLSAGTAWFTYAHGTAAVYWIRTAFQ